MIQTDQVAQWRNRRGASLNNWTENWMKVLFDNVLYTQGYASLFDMPATDLESIEIVPPKASDPRLIMNNAMNGLIIIISNRKARRIDIPSNGINIKPTGISIPQKDDIPSTQPLAPGQHIAVDIITPTQQIISWEE